MTPPLQIAVTGAAGQISYSLLFRLIHGDLTGPEQPLILRLLEVPEAMRALQGVVMELADCAAPLLQDVVVTSDPYEVFEDVDLAFLVGARPRGPGMERKDLLQVNADIFSLQGRALNAVAKRDVRVLVVGNPVNTNALIALHNAPELSVANFSAMTRLDHNRALSCLADQCGCSVSEIRQMVVWGNHSTTQYPDLHHALVAGRSALNCVDFSWFRDGFIPLVQKRGASIIDIRGKSSAASAANAAINQMRDWLIGTPDDDWVSMAVLSDGRYGIASDLMYSFPVRVTAGHYQIVSDLPVSEFSLERMRITESELLAEREMVRHLLG